MALYLNISHVESVDKYLTQINLRDCIIMSLESSPFSKSITHRTDHDCLRSNSWYFCLHDQTQLKAKVLSHLFAIQNNNNQEMATTDRLNVGSSVTGIV